MRLGSGLSPPWSRHSGHSMGPRQRLLICSLGSPGASASQGPMAQNDDEYQVRLLLRTLRQMWERYIRLMVKKDHVIVLGASGWDTRVDALEMERGRLGIDMDATVTDANLLLRRLKQPTLMVAPLREESMLERLRRLRRERNV